MPVIILCFPGCSEIADHVVHRAKARLKKRQRKHQPSLNIGGRSFQATPSPSTSPSKSLQVAATLSTCRQTKNVTYESCQSQPLLQASLAPFISRRTDVLRSTMVNSPGRQLELMDGVNSSSSSPAMTRSLKVVYWSERQSVTPKDTGVPNVPPVTPSACMYQLHAVFSILWCTCI